MGFLFFSGSNEDDIFFDTGGYAYGIKYCLCDTLVGSYLSSRLAPSMLLVCFSIIISDFVFLSWFTTVLLVKFAAADWSNFLSWSELAASETL